MYYFTPLLFLIHIIYKSISIKLQKKYGEGFIKPSPFQLIVIEYIITSLVSLVVLILEYGCSDLITISI